MQRNEIMEPTLYLYTKKVADLFAEGWQVSDKTENFPVFDGISFRCVLIKEHQTNSDVKLEQAVKVAANKAETAPKAVGRGRSKGSSS